MIVWKKLGRSALAQKATPWHSSEGDPVAGPTCLVGSGVQDQVRCSLGRSPKPGLRRRGGD